jgi:hypothetical protein
MGQGKSPVGWLKKMERINLRRSSLCSQASTDAKTSAKRRIPAHLHAKGDLHPNHQAPTDVFDGYGLQRSHWGTDLKTDISATRALLVLMSDLRILQRFMAN